MEFQDKILKPSKKKWVGVLLASLIFTVACIGMLSAGEQTIVAILGLLLFGAGIPLSLIQLLSTKNYLLIDSSGITISSAIRKPWALTWQDVEGFSIFSTRGGSMVAIAYSANYQGQRVGRAVSAQMTGVEGGLPDTYGMSAENLCSLLNSYLAHYKPQSQPSIAAQQAVTPTA